MPTANMIQGSLLQLSGTLTGHIAPKVGAASQFATFVIPSPLSSVCTAHSSSVLLMSNSTDEDYAQVMANSHDHGNCHGYANGR